MPAGPQPQGGEIIPESGGGIISEQRGGFIGIGNEVAKRARKCGEQRNIVAHTPFMASSVSDGVQFFPISASSKLEMPDMDWSIDDFLDHIDNINKIDNDLRSIEKRMPLQRIAEALLRGADAKSSEPDMTPPIGGLFKLGANILDDQES
jgi:hypothetical protein